MPIQPVLVSWHRHVFYEYEYRTGNRTVIGTIPEYSTPVSYRYLIPQKVLLEFFKPLLCAGGLAWLGSVLSESNLQPSFKEE